MKNETFLSRIVWDTSQLLRKSLTSLKALTLLLVMCLSIGNAWGATGKYVLLKDVSKLSANDTVIIANNAGAKAISGISTTSTKYGTLADVTVEKDSIITLSNSSVEEFVVEVGSNSTGWSFKGTSSVSGYLWWTSGNSLNKNATKSANTSWTISLSSGTATIANCGTTTRIMRFNSDRFACYTSSTGTLVKIFKKSHPALKSISVSSDHRTFTVGDAFVKETVTATYDDESQKDVTAAAIFSGYNLSATGDQTVNVSYAENAVEKQTSYGIVVNAASGSKVTVTANPAEGGEPIAEPNNNIAQGTEVTLSANPKTGYVFKSWYAIDDDLQEITVTNNKFYMPATNVEVEAKYDTIHVSSVTLNKQETTLEVDASEPLIPTVLPADALVKTLAWASDDETVATVTQTGIVTAVKAGTANITATSNNSKVATCAVTVITPLPRVVITADSVPSLTTTYQDYTWRDRKEGVTGHMFAYKQNGMQFNNSKQPSYYVYNTDPLPGNIRSIKMTTHNSGTEREWKVSVSTSQITSTSSGTEQEAKTVAKAGTTWNITGNNKYFCLEDNGGSSNISEIVIAYEPSTDPSIIVTPKPRHFEALDTASCDSVFNIASEYLTGSMEATIIGDNADKFSAGDIVDNKVTVTFTPKAVGNFSAKLVVKSVASEVVEASDTVALTGEGLNSNIPVTSVTINKQELSLEKDASETLIVEVLPENASVKTVTWFSDNTEVATVDANGLVTAVKKGTANIIATSNNGIKDTCVLTVTLPAYWEKVTAAKDNWAGEYLLVYENSNTAYVWTGIDNANCNTSATIADGQILKPSGAVTVTLAAMDGGYSVLINGGANNGKYLCDKSGKADMVFSESAVAFTPSYATNCTQLKCNAYNHYLRYNANNDQKRFRFYAEAGQQAIQLYEKASTEPSVKLNKKETSLSVGAKETLTATVKNAEATPVWSTSDATKATVENGVVTAVAEGTAKIYATITVASVNYVDSCVVTVTPAATVTSVTIAPQDTTLYIYGTTPTKQSATFTATVAGENEPAQTVTWKSLDEEVATVSEAGVVSAVAAGTTKIVAISTVDDTKSDTADVVVKVFENTAETAYTTAEAIAWIDALGTAIKDIKVYVKGVVSKNDGLSSGTITYWLDDNAFEVYCGKGINGDNFTSADEIKVGDHVVAYGKLKKYNSTYEFDYGSTLISRKTAAVLTWSAATYSAELGLSSYDFPILTKTPSNIENVVYESSNTAAATIDPATGEITLVAEGNTTIKASFAGNDSLLAAVDATYELTVAAEVKKYTITYNSNGGSAIAPVAEQTNLPATFPTPTKDWKVFGGWYLDNDVFEVPAVANMPLTKDTTLFAKWDEPKSVTEMLAMIPESGDEVDNVYGWGYIKAGASVSSGYAYYYITDGSDNDFYIYKGLNVNGESFTSADQLPSGNKVMIFGTIKNFKGTPEFDQGSRIINNAAVEVPVTGVSLNKAAAEVMVDKNITLIATIAPSHASNQNVTWSSNKESIATVDATGKVTGVAAGDATITVTTEDGGFQASCVVTVVAAPTFDNGVWVKVTNTTDLTADSYVIIAAKSYTKAIKTYVSGNNHGAQDVTVSGKILSYTTAPAIFQVKDYVKSEATVGKAFLNIESGNYLYLPDNNNKLTETASMEDKSAFTFAITDGVHSLTNYSLTGRQMKYNNSSSCFACYTSGQDNIVVYKYIEGAVAMIGNNFYSSFDAAFAAAQAGDNIELLANVNLTSTLTIDKKLAISGAYTITADADLNPMILGAAGAELELINVTLDANQKGRAIRMNAGKLTITGATITGAKSANYIGGVYMTGESEFVMTSGSITGNAVADQYASDGYLQYSADLWIGSQAKGTVSGGEITNAFVNSNSFGMPQKGLTMTAGTITNVFVEAESGKNASFTFTDGTVDKIIMATNDKEGKTSADTKVIESPASGKVYTLTTETRLAASDFAGGTISTICLPGAVTAKSITGCTVYSIAYKELVGGDPSKVYIDQVTEMAAGVPYIIVLNSGASEATFKYIDESATIVTAAAANGLQGTYTKIEKAEDNVLVGKYILYQNTIAKCGTNCSLGAKKAYIDMSLVPEEATAPAPGRRRIALGTNAANTPTGLDAFFFNGEGVKKMVMDGQMFILRDGKMFNAQGQLVK